MDKVPELVDVRIEAGLVIAQPHAENLSPVRFLVRGIFEDGSYLVWSDHDRRAAAVAAANELAAGTPVTDATLRVVG